MASAEERVKEHWDIPKLVNDKKSYKGLTLSNDMKVLIISDPEAGDKCYFALDINIGKSFMLLLYITSIERFLSKLSFPPPL